jgi:hypothetical protein
MELESGLYKEYLDKYPDRCEEILYDAVANGGLSREVLDDFIRLGIDINGNGNLPGGDGSPTTLLCNECEFLQADGIKLLLNYRCDVNKHDESGFSPLEMVILGHSGNCLIQYDRDNIKECMELLLNAGSSVEIRSWIADRIRDYIAAHPEDEFFVNFNDTMIICDCEED